MKKISIIQPDDWHVHFRDEEMLKLVVPETDKVFGKCIVMPNLVPPITNNSMAIEYQKRIKKHLKKVKTYLTIYLTENTDAENLVTAFKEKNIFAVKLYPLGATTNSNFGIKNLKNIMSVLAIMEKNDIPLLIHGEDTDPNIDIFDREKYFIDRTLSKIVHSFPSLRITLEHITTFDAINFIKSNSNIVGSITPHHLASNRNDMLVGGIRPHLYCLPILKRKAHQKELIKAAVSGNKKFFLGTDSAPHEIALKENQCGCAGVFNTTYTIQILTQIFENYKALNNLEKFVSINGSKHYKLPINKNKISLIKMNYPIKFKEKLKFNDIEVKIYKPNFDVFWNIKE
tara:strand:- start:424 stop:1452 length:1029 start_codon:yes stop_codon:yes gene_type:complete